MSCALNLYFLLTIIITLVLTGLALKMNISSQGYGEGNGTLLQYFCLENPMDGGTWWAAVHAVAKSGTRLRDFTFTLAY